jgi:Cu(I)/Ag(I) efflux system membrane fusion protein
VRSQLDAAALVVPSEAVIVTGERTVVIVRNGAGGFEVAEVQVGTESRGQTSILSGLREGQSIVLSGQFLIDSEASLESAINRLTRGTSNEPPLAPDDGRRP